MRDSASAWEISTLSPSLARAEPIMAMMRFVLCIVIDDIKCDLACRRVLSTAGCLEYVARHGDLASEFVLIAQPLGGQYGV